MKIVIGLGNIGDKYVKTRHNCGFLVLDELTKQLEKEGIEVNWKEDFKLKAIIAKITYLQSAKRSSEPKGEQSERSENLKEPVLLAKPTTLMNLSGEAVSKILNFYKEPIENLTVIYDDIDLPLGTIRVRDKGSAGTHNGMRSIIEQLGHENFKRIRLGIESRGQLTPEQQELHNYVLTGFSKEEYPLIAKAIKDAVAEIKKLL